MNQLKNRTFQLEIHHILLTSTFLFLLILAGCTSTRYDSRQNWHRSPASTGRNKCGCLLNPAGDQSIQLNQPTVYALQA
jgi:hypothetical protein